MDEPNDFSAHPLTIGDLVKFCEHKYHPDIYTDKTIQEGSVGIIVDIQRTTMGYLVHHVAWLKENLVMAAPRSNLKLVYSKK